MKFAALALLLAAPAQAPPFEYSVSRVTSSNLPYSWRAGCPVGPARLRRVRLLHWGFDRRPHRGTIDVHVSVAGDVVRIFRRLYAERFPIRRMRSVDVYGANDDRSMAADNTSAFNCRFVAGTRRWSMHAYGQAIDVNPVENPYISGAGVQPPAGRAYLNRSRVRPGMAVERGSLVRAFDAAGWKWGGRWAGTRDYQHFSTTGR
jgi:D-alanyl-D-alanine carboxypeptidase